MHYNANEMKKQKNKYKHKHKLKCERCEKSFLGQFNQKYCSTQCRAANWYTLKRQIGNQLLSSNESTHEMPIPLEINGKELQNCPLCGDGQLYTPGGQPYIIKCSNIYDTCQKGYWLLSPNPYFNNQKVANAERKEAAEKLWQL
jgi:hypothetical protein